MKKILSILILVFTSNIYSQNLQLYENNWFLKKLIIGGIEYIPPSNDEVEFVSATFLDNNIFYTSVCAELSGSLVFNEPQFQFSDFGVTLIGCGIQQNNTFQELYLDNFFVSNINNLFNYEIINENSINTLIITNLNGDNAFYDNITLSNENYKSKIFSIYPNPGKEIITLSNLNFTQDNLFIKIYSTNGRLVLSKTIRYLPTTSLIISELDTGLYFLDIETETGYKQTFKLIKE